MYADCTVSAEGTATDYLLTTYYLQKFCGFPISNKDRQLGTTESSVVVSCIMS